MLIMPDAWILRRWRKKKQLEMQMSGLRSLPHGIGLLRPVVRCSANGWRFVISQILLPELDRKTKKLASLVIYLIISFRSAGESAMQDLDRRRQDGGANNSDASPIPTKLCLYC